MTGYRVKKYILAGMMLIGYFLFRNIFWYQGVLQQELQAGHTKEEVLNSLLLGSYFSSEETVLIGTLILVLLADFLADREELLYMIRYQNRNRYLWIRCKRVMMAGVLISSLKMCCGVFYLLQEFGTKYILTEKIGEFTLWYTVLFFFYSVRCGIIYMLVRDLINKRTIATGIVMAAYFLIYYIYVSQWLYLLLHIEVPWVPFCDLDAPGAVYMGLAPKHENYLVTVRQLSLTLSTAIIWTGLWQRKDVIRLEK